MEKKPFLMSEYHFPTKRWRYVLIYAVDVQHAKELAAKHLDTKIEYIECDTVL